MSIDKIKDRIQKLLNLSMSDNEHEAALALEKATDLMNRWNLDAQDIDGTKVVIERRELNFFKWDTIKLELIGGLCEVSDTAMSYYSGRKTQYKHPVTNKIVKFEKTAGIFISGRKRDIDNTLYLFDIILRNVVKAAQKYKLSIRNTEISKNNKKRIDAFKYGYITEILEKLSKEKVKFFSENKALICIDSEVKLKEAKEKLKSDIDFKVVDSKQISFTEHDYINGMAKAKELELNNGVNTQNKPKLEYKG